MKIVKPNVTLWIQCDNIYAHIAECARVCYASTNNTKDKQTCEALWYNKHRSMFRHAAVYYIIPEKVQVRNEAYIGATVRLIEHYSYVSTNEQCAREYWDYRYKKYRISQQEAEANEVFRKHKLLRYTFCIDTGIDITRELNRVSPNNIAEQSTRYVDFTKKVGIKFKKCHWMFHCNWYRTFLYKAMLTCSSWFYKIARSKYGLDLPAQDARFILPLDTMSKVVYTYTVREWENIINLRLFDYTGPAHKDAKIVAKEIYNILTELGYNIINFKEHEKLCSNSI